VIGVMGGKTKDGHDEAMTTPTKVQTLYMDRMRPTRHGFKVD